MATITERFNREGHLIGWQAKNRKAGFPPKSKTFDKESDAKKWATIQESEMARGVFVDRSLSERMTLGEAIEVFDSECHTDP